MLVKLTDYVAQFLAKENIHHVFGLTGGAVVHLFDSIAKQPSMKPVFMHHEQAASFAAQAYARVRNGLGAALVTTGPGGTNAMTGLAAAWLDSIPCIFLSGQTRLAHTTNGKPIRQLGTQQLDIISLVKPMTKYAVMVEDAKEIKFHLQKAVFMATTGRPGPVWIDIPLDFQWSMIHPDSLPEFKPNSRKKLLGVSDCSASQMTECLKLLKNAKRPLVLIGYGVRLAHAEKELERFIEKFQIPCLASWNASDLIGGDHPLYLGRPGIFGQRGANLAIQNCDLLLSVGSHLAIPLTGTMFNAFARDAKKIIVDIDSNELKHRTIPADLRIHCDAKIFLQKMLKHSSTVSLNIRTWKQQCQHYQMKFNGIDPKWREQKKLVNPYVFVDALSKALNAKDRIVVDGGGTVNQITFQSFQIKQGQRMIIDAGLCAMGSGLPESVGACFGSQKQRTICLCGDGSFQLNVQELQTIVNYNLPVKIFILNNGGYLSIRQTQDGFLEGRHIGSDAQGGMSLPDVTSVAKAYGLKTVRITNHSELSKKIHQVLSSKGPVLCEILVSKDQEVMPRQGFDKKPDGTNAPRPLEDMYPYLDRKEFIKNMMIKPWS